MSEGIEGESKPVEAKADALRVEDEIAEALVKAQQKHAPMHGPHEGYAVILEEVEELWELVRAQKHDPAAMKKEALHIAAMAARFVVDVCDAALREGGEE